MAEETRTHGNEPETTKDEGPKMRFEDRVCFAWLVVFGALILGAVVKAMS